MVSSGAALIPWCSMLAMAVQKPTGYRLRGRVEKPLSVLLIVRGGGSTVVVFPPCSERPMNVQHSVEKTGKITTDDFGVHNLVQ